jgi:hypothetical protein
MRRPARTASHIHGILRRDGTIIVYFQPGLSLIARISGIPEEHGARRVEHRERGKVLSDDAIVARVPGVANSGSMTLNSMC